MATSPSKLSPALLPPEDVPFVPAWDLIMSGGAGLTAGEIEAIALALYTLVPSLDDVEPGVTWRARARIDGVSRRV